MQTSLRKGPRFPRIKGEKRIKIFADSNSWVQVAPFCQKHSRSKPFNKICFGGAYGATVEGKGEIGGWTGCFIGLYACIDMYKYLCEEEEESKEDTFNFLVDWMERYRRT